jgi:hypothetical protein
LQICFTNSLSLDINCKASIESIEKAPKIENEPVDKKIEPQLISVLTTITGRSKKEIQASLEKLERRDFLRLTDLYKNYNKIQKYSKLITEMGVLQKFKTVYRLHTMVYYFADYLKGL